MADIEITAAYAVAHIEVLLRESEKQPNQLALIVAASDRLQRAYVDRKMAEAAALASPAVAAAVAEQLAAKDSTPEK